MATKASNRPKVEGPDAASGLLREDLRNLLARAYDLGFVITVELEPLKPLAMGNYRMIGEVRPARQS